MDFALALIIIFMMHGISYTLEHTVFADKYYPNYDYIHFIAYPIATITILLAGKPFPMYATGVALAYLASYVLYIAIDTIWPRDMVGGDHLLASPGALAGAIVALIFLKKYKDPTHGKSLALGFAGTLFGFMVTNEIFCNTVTYCGPLSAIFYTTEM